MTRYCKRTAYLVQDYGGIFGASWTDDVRVFHIEGHGRRVRESARRAHGQAI